MIRRIAELNGIKSLMCRLVAVLLCCATAACDKEGDQVAGDVKPAPKKETTNEPRRLGIVWEAKLPLGTVSSPRLARSYAGSEILMAFGHEFAVAGGLVAVDVDSGQFRWQLNAEQELFSLPVPLTPWPGGERPWVVGGRDGQLHAVDLVSGEVLWRFLPFGEEARARGIHNFYTGLEFGDANGDGTPDFLVANGGDSKRGTYEVRPSANLAVLSGADGTVIHWIPVPNGRESYCSPLIWHRMGDEWVVFGSGGETFPGALWGVPAQSVRAGHLEGVRVLVSHTDEKGAIAPPSFADLDGDGETELIAVPFDGRLVVLSGRTMEPLWSFDSADEEETQSSPAVGDFDGDGDLDVVTVEQVGVFPKWMGTVVRVFDGASGEQLWDHRVSGNLVPQSPLAVDLDADGRDEILITESNPAIMRGERSKSLFQVVHVDEGRTDTVATADGANFGTGWVGDADGDGVLEWFVPLVKRGGYGSLLRINLSASAPDRIAWGGYLGTRHDGQY